MNTWRVLPVRAGLLSTKAWYVVLSFVIRWYNMNSTTKCLKRLQKRSVDGNLRQLVTIGVNKTKSRACKLKYLLLYKWLWFFFFTFPKKWVGREIKTVMDLNIIITFCFLLRNDSWSHFNVLRSRLAFTPRLACRISLTARFCNFSSFSHRQELNPSQTGAQ